MVKKGTAKVVKKPNAKAYSSSEDEDVTSEAEDKIPGKANRKGKGNTAAAKGTHTGPAKGKKWKADMPAKTGEVPIHEDEDADVDSSHGDGYHDGMIEMQFDECA